MRAATTPLERLRRNAVRDQLALRYLLLRGPFITGDLVWALFGTTGGLQLARIRMANPVALEGKSCEWWWVDVYWPTRGRWIATHRRVLRALSADETASLRNAGVVEARA